MNHAQRIFAVLIAFTLVFSSVAPAFAATSQVADKVQVQFQNKTGSPVRITLTGPATVSINLGTGKTKSELAPGTYKYSYEACDKTNTGTFKVRSNGDTLTLPKCTSTASGSSKTVTISIRNDTGQVLRIVLVGPRTYTFTVSSGQNGKFTMEAGKYSYTVSGYGCGGYSEDKGTVNIKKDFKWHWFCV